MSLKVIDGGKGNKVHFPDKDAAALEAALGFLGVEVRWNTRRIASEYKAGDGPWTAFNDRYVGHLQETIAATFNYSTSRGASPLHFGRESWDRCFNALLHRCEVDPFQEWLDNEVPAWDRVPRLDTHLVEVFGCEDSHFSRWAGRYVFMGAVWRTRRPGCKLDEFPILTGPTGIGKSAYCREIFPHLDEAADWFNDGLRLSSTDKEKAEAMRGAVVVEFSELSGIKRADVEHLKSFLTRRNDGTARMAYARHKERQLRTCVFIGTTNEVECLPNDPTGNRRFVPIPCPRGCDVEAFMDEHREMLWAEAINYYEAEYYANLPRELIEEQKVLAEKHRRRDKLAEEFLERKFPAGRPFTLADIVAHEFLPRELRIGNGSSRLTTALQVLGYKHKQFTYEGRRGRYYWKDAPGEQALDF